METNQDKQPKKSEPVIKINSWKEIKPEHLKLLAYGSFGKTASVTNFQLTEIQRMNLHDITEEFKKFLDEVIPLWKTFNIEIKGFKDNVELLGVTDI